MKTDQRSVKGALTKAGLVLLTGLSQSALAVDWYVSGFIRQEGAYSLNSSNENPWNQSGNVYNGVEAPNAVEQLLGLSPGTVTRPASSAAPSRSRSATTRPVRSSITSNRPVGFAFDDSATTGLVRSSRSCSADNRDIVLRRIAAAE